MEFSISCDSHLSIWAFFLLMTGCASALSTATSCPDINDCECYMDELNLFVDCSARGLTELPDFSGIPVQVLNLADNLFSEVPPQLAALDNLLSVDLSGNRIKALRSDALYKLTSLQKLDLSNNNITNLSDLNPNVVLRPAENLKELILSSNPIETLSPYDTTSLFFSQSLHTLVFSYCQIYSIRGANLLKGLTGLKVLDVSNNPLKVIQDLRSDTLELLDLSDCQLSVLPQRVFHYLTRLITLNLSRNHRLVMSTSFGHVGSNSLKNLEMAHCNVDQTGLEGFPNLTKVILKGNMIRRLTDRNFESNTLLEDIDLSFNAIASIHLHTFRTLTNLNYLDLSYNVIPRLDPGLFSSNKVLTTINLSRNYLSRLERLSVESLLLLDMSWCEILTIDKDALSSMPGLVNLNLSHNLISEIPNNLYSKSLQTLDLSLCRITSLRNESLQNLTELSRINLAGNRFTTPFRINFFSHNQYLQDIRLADNPWRCECSDKKFLELFLFLTDPPAKIFEKSSLRCESPPELGGYEWEFACYVAWNPNAGTGTQTEKVWIFMMVTLFSLSTCLCFVYCVRKAMMDRLQAVRAEESRLADELVERQRQARLQAQQIAQANAPDPRDLVSPPDYEEALLMPRLDGSYASLDHLPSSSRENIKKILMNRKMSNIENGATPKQVISLRDLTQSTDSLSRRRSPYSVIRNNAIRSMTNINTNGRMRDYSEHNIENITIEEVPSTSRNNSTTINISVNTTTSTKTTTVARTPPPQYRETNDELNITEDTEEILPVTVVVHGRERHESDL